jgi:predicted transcriptional regulator
LTGQPRRRNVTFQTMTVSDLKQPTPDEFPMTESAYRLLTLTTQIAVAYMGANAVNASAVPELLRVIQRSLTDLEPDRTHGEPEQVRPVQPRPVAGAAVDIRKSVFANHLVCLEEGKHVTMLKRHLATAHGLTPELYRKKWGLPATYPMVAPNYAKVRSRLAKEAGLGRGGRSPK